METMSTAIKDQLQTDNTRTAMRQSYFAKWDGEKFVYGIQAANLRTFERLAAQRAATGSKGQPLTGLMVELMSEFDEHQREWAKGMLA